MTTWTDLPLKDRHKYIKIGVANGYTDLNEIKDMYNKFALGGDEDGDNTSSIDGDDPIIPANWPLIGRDHDYDLLDFAVGVTPGLGTLVDGINTVQDPSAENIAITTIGGIADIATAFPNPYVKIAGGLVGLGLEGYQAYQGAKKAKERIKKINQNIQNINDRIKQRKQENEETRQAINKDNINNYNSTIYNAINNPNFLLSNYLKNKTRDKKKPVVSKMVNKQMTEFRKRMQEIAMQIEAQRRSDNIRRYVGLMPYPTSQNRQETLDAIRDENLRKKAERYKEIQMLRNGGK